MPPRRSRNREAMRRVGRWEPPDVSEADLAPQAQQIVPTRLELVVIDMPGARYACLITWTSTAGRNWTATSVVC